MVLNSAIRKALFGSIVLAFMSSIAACNTIKGAGQDVQAGGSAVEKGATDVQQDMQK